MLKLIFATNNKYKIREIENVIGTNMPDGSHGVKILSLGNINCFEEVPESTNTLEGNASEKAFYVYNKYGVDCFADDTGLEIEALNGKPGVLSARYASESKNFENNINKVLREMEGISNRKARFRTVISLIIDGEERIFEGIIYGIIINEKRGNEGFGYDSIFQPNGYNITFAEMTLDEKNKISHRYIAVKKLINYLNQT